MNLTTFHQSVFLPGRTGEQTLPEAAHDPAQNQLYSILAYRLGPDASATGWILDAWAGHAASWTYVRHSAFPTPSQGWKLHVSSDASCAIDVLGAALDVLLNEPVHFKFAADLSVLRRLNRGELGMTQVGKFITVYPVNDEQAVRLANRLHECTAGFGGPAIPTDRQFLPDSLVSFRFGDFLGREEQLSTGERRPVLEDPQGMLVPDLRLNHYHKPDWVQDPFGGGVERTEVPGLGDIIADRFLIVGALAELPRGSVMLAVDLIAQRRCVVKTARKHCYADHRGRDACHYLRREFEMLAALTDDPRVPTPYQLADHGRDLLMLVMEDFAGEQLDRFVAQRLAQGAPLTDEEVVRLGIAATQIVADLHGKGISHADIKSANLIVSPEGQLQIIDFGIAQAIDCDIAERPPGTRGYRSHGKDAVHADTYALVALIYFLATGAEPSRAPNEFNLLGRPIAVMAPFRRPALVALIETFLGGRDSLTPAALLAALRGLDLSLPESGGVAAAPSLAEVPTTRSLVLRFEHAIVAALGSSQRSSSSWAAAATQARDLGDGRAGTVLALAEIVAATRSPAALAALRLAAHCLSSELGPLPGLYAGESGVGLALLRAGQVTADQTLIALATERNSWIAAQPHTSPDVFVGSAGRLLFHLLLWNETSDAAALYAADVAGQALLRSVSRSARGWSWTIPAGFDRMSGQCYLGYAHGAAGIGDTLLELFAVTGNQAYLEAAGEVVRFVIGHAQLLANGGANWTDTPGGRMFGTCWCHGAAGVGLFLAHAHATGRFPEVGPWVDRAGLAVAAGSRVLSPGQCHGLAGGIEFLLDLYLATSAPRWLDEALSLRTLLEAFVVERDGGAIVCSEHPEDFACSYLNGYAGVAACLSRFDGERISPRFISMARFSRPSA